MDTEIRCSIEDCIKRLQNKDISCFSDIPKDYWNQRDIAKITRAMGLRKTTKCGYDIIADSFFVEEDILEYDFHEDLSHHYVTFDDFGKYFEFLQGEIYENSCYYQYAFTADIIDQFQLDVDRLNMRSSLNYTIDDILPEPSRYVKEEFDAIEHQAKLRKQWIKKYNDCTTLEELLLVNARHMKSKDSRISNENTDESFYLWNYINYHGDKAFDTIVKFVCTGQHPASVLENELCFLFGAERVLKAYNYTGGVASNNKKHNSQFKRTVERIANSEVTRKTIKYFDEYTHYYCVKTIIYLNADYSYSPDAQLYRYFETFEEFAIFLENDLSDCDLSKAINLNVDFSAFKMNNATKLPVHALPDLKRTVSKSYNRIKSRFEVIVKWYNTEGVVVFKRENCFEHFFDFVAFLNNDLSEADLLFCDGLQNITDFSDFNFQNARIQSALAKKIGLHFDKYELLKYEIEEFATISSNETETSVILKADRTELSTPENSPNKDERKIYYITDLHLMHRIHHAHCKTRDDCIYVIQRIIDTLLIDALLEDKMYQSLILIGGDIASEFWVYELFVNLLRKTIDELQLKTDVVFVLGNHELWEFQGYPLDRIVEKYRCLLANNNMHLIQNEILYLLNFNNEASNILCITQEELNKLTDRDIRERLRTARTVIFGGIGFSGYNREFNADNGIYRSTLHREEEVSESKTFEKLYDRICACLPDKNTVVFTHMPFTDWHKEGCRQNHFVYVSGHNHKNVFCDDGDIRIYADNQVGYRTEHPKLKYFYIDDIYDWFSDYEDGIYTITREDYINFYRGKNLDLTFNRNINKLYMLKKNNYSCFIHENASGGLTILNGGSLKKLNAKSIRWYYDNMDEEIARIKGPFDKYYSIQLQISKTIREIGGVGKIHGAIIDIDFYNHIFVNPIDRKITAYFAWDIFYKYPYPSVAALLKANCPSLYANYLKLLSENQAESVFSEDNTTLTAKPKLYIETDFYRASRVIKKMQKTESNILSIWSDSDLSPKRTPTVSCKKANPIF